MTLTNAIKNILSLTANPLTPQEIKALVKEKYPYLYGTVSHISNVEKGHYKNLDHALLAQIYTIVKTSSNFFCELSSAEEYLPAYDDVFVKLIEDYRANNTTSTQNTGDQA